MYVNREVNKQLRDENDSLRVVLEKTRANAAAAVAANATPTYVNKNKILQKIILNFYRL